MINFSRAVILPYKVGSRSAKQLAIRLREKLQALVRRVRPDGMYRPKRRSLIINYGNNTRPWWLNNIVPILNKPEACRRAGNKLIAFNDFKRANLSIPEYTDSHAVATMWYNDDLIVVCRTLLTAHSGRGIVLSHRSANKPLVRAPLYVKYKKKKKEFRVHVFQGQIIDICEKRRFRRDRRPDNFDGFIRNHANGWSFCRSDIQEPHDLRVLSIAACAATSLDFGAVDIIWNEKENKSYLLEVNTAPGLVGTTLLKYSNSIYNWIRSNL